MPEHRALLTPARIENERDRIYRRSRARSIHTLGQAARFIDTVGFCLLFASAQGIELPSLFEAVKGRRDVHIEDWDADSDRVWVWKNDLPAQRRAYYGKALASGKPVFISLAMLPFLYAVSAPEDMDHAYARGAVSYEAKRLYDALRSSGPTPTIALRRTAGLDTERYHRALDQLQRALIALPVGATVETGAWTSQIFDLVTRWFPDQVQAAAQLDLEQARRALVKRYVKTVVAAKPQMIVRIFHWSREQVDTTLQELVQARIVTEKEGWIVPAR